MWPSLQSRVPTSRSRSVRAPRGPAHGRDRDRRDGHVRLQPPAPVWCTTARARRVRPEDTTWFVATELQVVRHGRAHVQPAGHVRLRLPGAPGDDGRDHGDRRPGRADADADGDRHADALRRRRRRVRRTPTPTPAPGMNDRARPRRSAPSVPTRSRRRSRASSSRLAPAARRSRSSCRSPRAVTLRVKKGKKLVRTVRGRLPDGRWLGHAPPACPW